MKEVMGLLGRVPKRVGFVCGDDIEEFLVLGWFDILFFSFLIPF